MASLVSDTVYEPSASDPRVVAALAAQKRLGDVMLALDIAGIETLMAPDLLVNAPINKVAHRENVIARLKASQIKVDYFQVADDTPVIVLAVRQDRMAVWPQRRDARSG